MYAKVTRSDAHSYLELVKGYRNAAGKVRHRVLANLGGSMTSRRRSWTP